MRSRTAQSITNLCGVVALGALTCLAVSGAGVLIVLMWQWVLR
ncbi:hypothetical protein [Rhodococcoides fascians]|nr:MULTISPECIES: hypothetical protein [Rhodococcus]